MKNRFRYGWFYRFSLAFLITLWGCSSGEIDNFANIRVESDYRVERLDLRIQLLNKNRNPLYWNESILTPEIGVSVLSESKFVTNAKIYSMRQGVKHVKVYDGRLIDLQWGWISGTNVRLLFAEIPHALIQDDPERDTEMGSIKVTLETDKQGPFSYTLENTRIYRSAP